MSHNRSMIKPTQHERAQAVEVRATTQYSGKSYSVQFECPTCQRKGRFNLSFLGLRRVICNGVKFEKVDKWQWESECDQRKEVSKEWKERTEWLIANKHKLTPDSTR